MELLIHKKIFDSLPKAKGIYAMVMERVDYRAVHKKERRELICKKGSLDRCHIYYVGVPYSLQEAYCFLWRSKVIWGQHESICENLVIKISHIWYVGVPYWVQGA